MISAVLAMEITAHCDEEQRTPYLDPYRLEILCIYVNGGSYALLALIRRRQGGRRKADTRVLLERHTYAQQPDHKDNATHTVKLFLLGIWILRLWRRYGS